MENKVYDCLIIGGGAAGLYCAAKLSRSVFSGKRVAIIEGGNRVGKKLALTGSGRCNLSNSEIDLSKYNTDDSNKLGKSISRYGYLETSDFYENVLGVVLEQKGTLIYPSTLKSSTVVDALRFYLADNKIETILNERVSSVSRNKFYELTTESEKTYVAKNLVIATGGITYPSTGSTGDIINILKDITDDSFYIPFKPALTSLTSDTPGIKALAGIRCRGDVRIVDSKGTVKAKSEGEILFTKEGGISGICVMDVSDSVVKLIDEGESTIKALLVNKHYPRLVQTLYENHKKTNEELAEELEKGEEVDSLKAFCVKKTGERLYRIDKVLPWKNIAILVLEQSDIPQDKVGTALKYSYQKSLVLFLKNYRTGIFKSIDEASDDFFNNSLLVSEITKKEENDNNGNDNN